jgi:hypothetical protein
VGNVTDLGKVVAVHRLGWRGTKLHGRVKKSLLGSFTVKDVVEFGRFAAG